MSNINNWEKFNELHDSTYRSAARKIKKMQPNRSKVSDRLHSHADSMRRKEIVDNLDYGKYPFMDKEFDMYVTKDQEDIDINGIRKFRLMNDVEDMGDEDFNSLSIGMVRIDDINDEAIFMSVFIYTLNTGLTMDIGGNPGCKFTSRKSYNDFLRILRKLYFMQDPNVTAKALSKINGSEVSEVSGDEDMRSNGTNLWNILERNGYTWDTFKSKVLNKIQKKLWDDLV